MWIYVWACTYGCWCWQKSWIARAGVIASCEQPGVAAGRNWCGSWELSSDSPQDHSFELLAAELSLQLPELSFSKKYIIMARWLCRYNSFCACLANLSSVPGHWVEERTDSWRLTSDLFTSAAAPGFPRSYIRTTHAVVIHKIVFKTCLKSVITFPRLEDARSF